MNFVHSLFGLTRGLGLALAITASHAAEKPLAIDPAHSRVEIGVKATVDSFTGSLEAYDAAITVDSDAQKITAARFSFKFADVKTGKVDRDEQMHAWQNSATHPDGEFVLASLGPDSTGVTIAKGTLTFHGVAREIAFPAAVQHEAGLYAIDGAATLDTREFGLPIIRKFGLLKVDPRVVVRFHLQGQLAPEIPAVSAN